ncbi:MAG TPA: ABC transporter permease subunit [Aestuariivirga sp.]
MLSWLSSVLQGYQWLLLDGLWQTLLISVLAYLIGSAIGFCLALANGTGVRSISIAIKTYTYLFRALPELILIMLLYYASDDLFGWVFKLFGFGQVQLNGTTAAIIVLAFVSAAFACEIFSAAIKAVPIGMVEDAISLGMGPMLRLRRIIFPIMLPLALPGLANLWLMVVRGSSLVSVVGVMELALAAEQGAGATKAYFAFYLAGMALYLVVALFTLQLFYKAEQHLRRGQLAI